MIIGLIEMNRIYTKEEIEKFCKRSFQAGVSYTIGDNKEFIQTHPNLKEWMNKINKL